MVEDLTALQAELDYARKYMGKLPCSAYTGMPKGSPTPGHSGPEEEVFAMDALEDRIEKKRTEIREDWAELESICSCIKPMQSWVLKLRYHYGAEWKDVCRELYGRRDDFETDLDKYKNRMYSIHNRAIQEMEKILEKQAKQ